MSSRELKAKKRKPKDWTTEEEEELVNAIIDLKCQEEIYGTKLYSDLQNIFPDKDSLEIKTHFLENVLPRLSEILPPKFVQKFQVQGLNTTGSLTPGKAIPLPYKPTDDFKIVTILRNSPGKIIHQGDKVWIELETLIGRNWQSVKQHFETVIWPKLDDYFESPADVTSFKAKFLSKRKNVDCGFELGYESSTSEDDLASEHKIVKPIEARNNKVEDAANSDSEESCLITTPASSSTPYVKKQPSFLEVNELVAQRKRKAKLNSADCQNKYEENAKPQLRSHIPDLCIYNDDYPRKAESDDSCDQTFKIKKIMENSQERTLTSRKRGKQEKIGTSTETEIRVVTEIISKLTRSLQSPVKEIADVASTAICLLTQAKNHIELLQNSTE